MASKRSQFMFICSECKNLNYIGSRNKSKKPDKMEVTKFCEKCNKHTTHKEKSK